MMKKNKVFLIIVNCQLSIVNWKTEVRWLNID